MKPIASAPIMAKFNIQALFLTASAGMALTPVAGNVGVASTDTKGVEVGVRVGRKWCVGIGVGVVRTVFENAWELVKSAVQTALDALEAAWDGTFGRLIGPIQAVIDKVRDLIGWVESAISRLNVLGGGFSGGGAILEGVESAASGGSGGQTSGPHGETRMKPRIAGRSSMGGGPMVLNLHVDGRMMGRAVAAASRRDGGYDFRIRAGG
jgi:hypothetical protein